MLELLVPAGSPEAVTAAVQNGADAVYLSFDELTGCRQAVNFSDSAFESAVRYCRVRGCRVYLAMNSPVFEEELQKAAGLALRAQRAGVDAVILRDLGLLRLLRRLLPEMPLFADVRMGFYTPEGAAAAARMGFRRIFLPPELSLEEIRRIAASGVETAVFAESSLCAAAAGTCRMSALSGRGSAERGLCSGLCRERYTFGGRWDDLPLSFRDRCLLDDLRALEDAGVVCACLGNRERRVEYTAEFTRVFRQAIRENQRPAQSEREELEKLYLPYGAARREIYEPAGEGKEPDRSAEKVFASVRRKYSEGEMRRVDVEFAVAARSETTPVRLAARDSDGHQAEMEGPPPSPTGEIALTDDDLREPMYRTAGTPFRCIGVSAAADKSWRVPAIELDMARRGLLFKLSEERSRVPERREGLFPETPGDSAWHEEPCAVFSFRTAEQMTPELASLQPQAVYAPLEVLAEHPEAMDPFRAMGAEVAAELPAALSGPEEELLLRDLLRRVHALGVKRVVAGNLGLAMIAREEGMGLRGDINLAVTNSHTLYTLASAGFLSAALSPELTLQQVQAMPKALDTELVVYGRLPAMVTQPCLLKASAGRCSCTVPGQMADAHGGVWPVTKHFGCRNTVWNARKLWLSDKAEDWVTAGLWAGRLIFSTESPRECLEVANSYLLGTDYRPNGMTRGMYYRGVL